MTKITPQNLLKHELIGLRAKVLKSTHPSYVGIDGTVVDETQNMLTILHENIPKNIPKRTTVFLFFLTDGPTVEVDGSEITARPEDRIKRSQWRKS